MRGDCHVVGPPLRSMASVVVANKILRLGFLLLPPLIHPSPRPLRPSPPPPTLHILWTKGGCLRSRRSGTPPLRSSSPPSSDTGDIGLGGGWEILSEKILPEMYSKDLMEVGIWGDGDDRWLATRPDMLDLSPVLWGREAGLHPVQRPLKRSVLTAQRLVHLAEHSCNERFWSRVQHDCHSLPWDESDPP